MLFTTTTLLALLTLSTHVASASSPPRYNYNYNHAANQLPIGDTPPHVLFAPPPPEPTETITIHYTVTQTLYQFEFRTKTATRNPPRPTTTTAKNNAAVVFAPVPFYAILPNYGLAVKGPPLRQKPANHEAMITTPCDESACALCRWQGGCRESDAMCFLCDGEPYCDCE